MKHSCRRAPAALVVATLSCLLAAGCAGVGPELAMKPPQTTTQVDVEAKPPATPQPATPPAPTPVEIPQARAIVPAQTPVPPPRPADSSAKAKPIPQPAPPATPKLPTVPVRSKSTPPPLDLAALEARLRDTKAIGVFTKISLKNQVDDLLNKFRAYYKRQTQTTLAELRRPYDMLLLKVLSLLQDSDPPLARDIVASREAIWAILANPEKFNEAKLMAGEVP